MLGHGTRTIVRDGGIRGAVLRLGVEFSRVHIEGKTLIAGAAAPMPAVLQAAATAGLSGLEELSGVSGSVGASVVWDRGWPDGLTPTALRRGREVAVEHGMVQGKKQAVVTGVRIELEAVGHDEAQRRLMAARRSSRPGRWYGPPKRGTVRGVVRAADLRQVRLRQVAIPMSAPEMLINLGDGTAADLALLHKSTVERVKQRRGEVLSSVMRWVGTR